MLPPVVEWGTLATDKNLELVAGGYVTWMGFKYETNQYYQKIDLTKLFKK